MDRSRYRKKVLLDLVSAPWVLLPAALGATLLIGGWAVGWATPLLAFLGVAGLLGGAGALVTRWITQREQITRGAFEALQAEARRQRARSLDDLYERLKTDNDPRTEQCLDALRHMQARYEAAFGPGPDGGARVPPVDIAGTVEKLLRSCIMSLERSLKLWATAQNMLTAEARQSVLASRERLLGEVSQSIAQLARTVDGLQALSLGDDADRDLAAIRTELDENLSVARRVDERMRSLESDLAGRVRDMESN